MVNYHYIIMSQKDMFENQVLEEIFRERANYFLSKNKTINFWLLISPKFLYSNKFNKKIRSSIFYNQKDHEILDELESQYYSVLLSPNKEFINWVKLRLGFFENICELNEKQIKGSIISDGLYGEINMDEREISDIVLKENKNLIHPSILSNKLRKTLEIINSKNSC